MKLLPLLRDAWYFYSRHLGAIALLCLPLILTESLARQAMLWLIGPATRELQELLAGLMFYPLYSAALILFLDSRSRHLATGSRRLLDQALRCWLPLAILTGCCSALVMLGLSFMVLPGLWLMARLAFAEYLLVLRQQTPLEAMRESFRMTRPQTFRLLVLELLVVVPLWALEIWLAGRAVATHPLLELAADGVSGLLQLFATVVFFRAWMLQDTATR